MELSSILTEILLGWIASLPIVVGLILNVRQLRHVEKAQKVSNQLEITKQHRDIWSQTLKGPEYERILKKTVDLKKEPLTNRESIFVTFLILHLKVSFRAKEANQLDPANALPRDIRWFFSLPIPKEVWKHSRNFQDEEFREFVDDCLE